MASISSSFREGQKHLLCDLCETNPSVVCKCIECKLFMCDNCNRKIHVKFPKAKNHKIVSIKDLGNHDEEMDFSGIKCGKHDAECCLYCKSCDTLVCPTCVSKTHNRHDLLEIQQAYIRKVETLRREKEINCKTRKEILSKIEKINKMKEDRIKKEEQEIENHATNLKQIIDKHVAKIKTELQQRGKLIDKAYQKDLKSLKTTREKVENNCKELEDLMTTTEAARVFKQFRRREILPVLIPRTSSESLPIPRFAPGNFQLCDMGTLVDEEGTTDLQMISLDIKNHFKTTLSVVRNIVLCSDNSLWLSCQIDKILHHVRIKDNKLKMLSSISVRAVSMTITPDNFILICAEGNSRLQQLNTSTNQMTETVYDVSPLEPISVHVTSLGKVVIGAVNNELRMEIIVMDSKGKQKQVYDNFNKQKFSGPWSITSTRNGNIHVVDMLPADERGKVVVLTPVGDTRNVYTGHPDVNKTKQFYPLSIVTTPRDNTIVTDVDTHHLHLLDSDGQLLTVYNTREVGIKSPVSLAFTRDHSLWIGCQGGSRVKNGKLYHVNVTCC